MKEKNEKLNAKTFWDNLKICFLESKLIVAAVCNRFSQKTKIPPEHLNILRF